MNLDSSWTAIALVLGVALVASVAILLPGRLKDRSGTGRSGVAAPSAPALSTLADLEERIGVLEADRKNLRREMADLETSFNRRWGSLTRQGRRDAKRDREDGGDGDELSHDDRQMTLLADDPPSAPAGAATIGRLVAASRLRR